MVLKPDQERVKKMIKETLTLLCKNGLSFDVHFSIEALIGVTLDDKDVFLVNINELIKSDKAEEMAGSSGEQSVGSSGEESSENDVSSDRKLTPGTGHKRKRHKRPLVKREPSHQDSSNEDEPNAKVRSDGQLGGELRVKKEAGNDSGSDQNVIVIKEELDDCWSEGGMQQDAATYGQYATDVPGTSQDQKFPSLSDVSLLPVESQDSSQVWSHAAAYATPGGVGRRMSRSSTTGSQLDPSQEVIRVDGEVRYRCGVCGSHYGHRTSLAVHQRRHRGQYQYYCPTCGKGCASTSFLKRHISHAHHGKAEFECITCGQTFERMKALTVHTTQSGHVDPYKKNR